MQEQSKRHKMKQEKQRIKNFIALQRLASKQDYKFKNQNSVKEPKLFFVEIYLNIKRGY